MIKTLIFGAEMHEARALLGALAELNIPTEEIAMTSNDTKSRNSASYGDHEIKFSDPKTLTFNKSQTIYNFEAKNSILKKAHQAGAKIYDMTGQFLGNPDAPLSLVPDANQGQIRLMSVPSAMSAMLVSALAPLADRLIERVVVSTYQGLSTGGREAMDELYAQSKAIFMNMPLKTEAFQKQIAYNALPHVGQFMDGGDMTTAEFRCMSETKQLLGTKIKVAVNAVHIPVFSGDAMMVNVSFKDEIEAAEARTLWNAQDDISVIDLQSEMEYVTPLEIQGEDTLFISRIREDLSVENGLSFWCAADSSRFLARKITILSAQDKIVKLTD